MQNSDDLTFMREDFLGDLLPWGNADIDAALQQFQDAGLKGDKLATQVKEYLEETDSQLKDVDICYIAYDYVLQIARNLIRDSLGFDICNDVENGTEFYTYGNSKCTDYDYSDGALEQLQSVIDDGITDMADLVMFKEMLDENKALSLFLRQVGVKIPKTVKTEVAA